MFGGEVQDEGKIACVLDTELVVAAVISENHGDAVSHTTSLRKSESSTGHRRQFQLIRRANKTLLVTGFPQVKINDINDGYKL